MYRESWKRFHRAYRTIWEKSGQDSPPRKFAKNDYILHELRAWREFVKKIERKVDRL